MFKAGYFSSEQLDPCQVDGVGLKRLSLQQLARGLQVTETNPINGLEGRAGLLSRLGDALRNTALFGREGRPGHMLGTVRDCPSSIITNFHAQIIFYPTPLPKLLPSLSLQSPPSGLSLPMVLAASGLPPVPPSMAFPSATHGLARLCLPRRPLYPGKILYRSTNLHNGFATRLWSQ